MRRKRIVRSLMVTAALAVTPSCNPAAWSNLGLSGTAVLYSKDGSKAGLQFEPGKSPVSFGKIAIRDKDGNIVGYVEASTQPKVIAEK